MSDAALISISILAFSVSLISLMLFLAENRKNKLAIDKKSDELLVKTEKESEQIISDAIKKAQTILVQAEEDEKRLVTQTEHFTEKLESHVEANFSQNSQKIQQVFQQELTLLATQAKQSQDQYQSYLATLRSKLDENQQANMDIIKNQTNTFFENFEQKLADFLTTTEQRAISSIDLEIKATKELVNTYKQQQLRLIDENILAILEKTLSLVLAKKLTLNDQSDLVFEALEKAKIEKFIT